MLSISGTSKGSADASTSSLHGIRRARRRDPCGRAAPHEGQAKRRRRSPYRERRHTSTLSLAIAVARGVSTAIRAPPFSMLREPRPTSPAATQPLRTSVPHNTANTANRCGLIALSPCYLVQGSTGARLDRHRTKLILGSKRGRAQDESRRLSSFSKCVA